jgi:hypothetical protein
MTPTEAAQLVRRAEQDRELRAIARHVARRLTALDRALKGRPESTAK